MKTTVETKCPVCTNNIHVCVDTDNTSNSASATGSIAWLEFDDVLPDKGETVLVYRDKTNPILAYQTIRYWHGDEFDYTHWMKLEPPKQ